MDNSQSRSPSSLIRTQTHWAKQVKGYTCGHVKGLTPLRHSHGHMATVACVINNKRSLPLRLSFCWARVTQPFVKTMACEINKIGHIRSRQQYYSIPRVQQGKSHCTCTRTLTRVDIWTLVYISIYDQGQNESSTQILNWFQIVECEWMETQRVCTQTNIVTRCISSVFFL